MAPKSTRNKIRYNVQQASESLVAAQRSLLQAAALADERSPYINENLPEIVTAIEFITESVSEFYGGL